MECFGILNKVVDTDSFDYCVEPSAGTGSFYKLIDDKKRIGLDLEPKYEGITKMDYFDFEPMGARNI